MDELADSPVSLRTLIGWRLYIQAAPGYRFDTYIEISGNSGKNRIARVENDKDYIQIGRQLALSLMLPEPTRSEPNLPSGSVNLRTKEYLVDEIIFEESFDGPSKTVLLTPNSVRVRNQDETFDVNYAQRFDKVVSVLDKIEQLPVPMRSGLLKLRAALRGKERLSAKIEAGLADIRRQIASSPTRLALEDRADLLESLEQILAFSDVGYADGILASLKARAKSELAKAPRVSRGKESEQFKREVIKAYSSRCAVCGLALPGFAPKMNPGIDACHILPYSSYDLDVVTNGIALCKLHHWAYDWGVIDIFFKLGDYRARLSDQASTTYEAGTLNQLKQMLPPGGIIAEGTLPADTSKWPDPRYLDLKLSLSL